MDAARQIVRFSIPGALLLLEFIVAVAVARRCQGEPFCTTLTPLRANVSAVVGIVATIPLGFLVYQLYYFNYDPLVRLWPFPWGGRLVRLDRGSQVLSRLTDDQLEVLARTFRIKKLYVGKLYIRAPKPETRLEVRAYLEYRLKLLVLDEKWRDAVVQKARSGSPVVTPGRSRSRLARGTCLPDSRKP